MKKIFIVNLIPVPYTRTVVKVPYLLYGKRRTGYEIFLIFRVVYCKNSLERNQVQKTKFIIDYRYLLVSLFR
jgi:hypothetical protein